MKFHKNHTNDEEMLYLYVLRADTVTKFITEGSRKNLDKIPQVLLLESSNP